MKYFLHLLENLVLAGEKIIGVDTNYLLNFEALPRGAGWG